MADWWQRDVVDAGRLPLLLLTVAFVVTFVVTRVVVRSIRAGKGPFSDNTVGGVHVHHVVPGLVLMVLGGLVALGTDAFGWTAAAAIVFGIGLALVLDEFALLLHLQDVYWEQEGRLSVDVVFLLLGVLVMVLLVGSPLGLEDQSGGETAGRTALVVNAVFVVACSVIAALKGKFASSVIGLVVPLVALVAAVRIARPQSVWATRRYRDDTGKQHLAASREERFDRRWRAPLTRLQDAVAGTPGSD
ncbi:MAG: hypothetical protein MUE36_00915 [Acidimicrobiales bacterium]|nr:hypothetical protein [Acidimicrobiales bacterium]